jgi:hypothetical protein
MGAREVVGVVYDVESGDHGCYVAVVNTILQSVTRT